MNKSPTVFSSLNAAVDMFAAFAISRFITKLEILSASDLLVYAGDGDNWPQPHPVTGLPPLPWADFPSIKQRRELADRIRIEKVQREQRM